MDTAQYGSSGIQWKRTEPGVVELSNTPPEMQAPPPPPPDPEIFKTMMMASGRGMTDKERSMMSAEELGMTPDELYNYSSGMQMRERTRTQAPSVKEFAAEHDITPNEARRGWRLGKKQIMSDDPAQRIFGFNKLMDQGLVWINPDDGGLYSLFPHGEKVKQQLLDVSHEWMAGQTEGAGAAMANYLKTQQGLLGELPPEKTLHFWSGLGQPSATSENPMIQEGTYVQPATRTLTTIMK